MTQAVLRNVARNASVTSVAELAPEHIVAFQFTAYLQGRGADTTVHLFLPSRVLLRFCRDEAREVRVTMVAELSSEHTSNAAEVLRGMTNIQATVR